jgi:catechol 2,3-dioxygenase-like lactoylglutathione lyase family enzyme
VKIELTSVYVDDQEKALLFYTDVLGFVKKADRIAQQATQPWASVTFRRRAPSW